MDGTGAHADRGREEGWFTDPFGRHEARWFSDGTPTKLVRDGEDESYDEPPDEAPSSVPKRIETPLASGGEDLYRADDQESGQRSRAKRGLGAAEFGATWGSHAAMPNKNDR